MLFTACCVLRVFPRVMSVVCDCCLFVGVNWLLLLALCWLLSVVCCLLCLMFVVCRCCWLLCDVND